MLPFPITRAEVSRSRLVGNFQYLRSLLPDIAEEAGNGKRLGELAAASELLAVVKANAYGNGLSLCAPWLVEAGARWLGVTSAEEGVAARQLCPDATILVMRGLLAGEADALLEARLVPTVWNSTHLDLLAGATRQRMAAAGSVPLHLEIDTGMSRQGVGLRALPMFLDALRKVPALHLAGVSTHFASAEMLDAEQNRQQGSAFRQALEHIYTAGFRPQWIHAGNSSTLLARQFEALCGIGKTWGARFLLRPGIALYGYAPAFSGADIEAAEQARARLQPVLSWRTSIVSTQTVEVGAAVGYDATFIARASMRLGLLPVGYADGLNRKLSGSNSSPGGLVLVRGVRAPIVGRVSMDLTVVDLSQIPNAATGDEVVILGE
ncbi:MAG: alanine racemase, partial [Acidobacteriaceae bacterium]